MESWETIFWIVIIVGGLAGICSLMALVADFCEWLADK
jgi:hypothetical protein